MTDQLQNVPIPTRTYLVDGATIPISVDVAVCYGVNHAAFIQQLHFLLSSAAVSDKRYNLFEGYWWVYYSYPKWVKHLPWLSDRTIRRIIEDLEAKGVVKTRSNPHNSWDKAKWYRLDYEVFYAEVDRSVASGQSGQIDQSKKDRSKRPNWTDDNIKSGNKDNASSDDVAQKPPRPPKNRMWDAIALAFGYISPVTMPDGAVWYQGDVVKQKATQIGTASAALIKAGYSEKDVPLIYAYCDGKFDTFGPMALTTNADDWKKTQRAATSSAEQATQPDEDQQTEADRRAAREALNRAKVTS